MHRFRPQLMTPLRLLESSVSILILMFAVNGDSLTTTNHKPVFTNCSKYLPSVKEEQPSGTFVFQVSATDIDPLESGGKVTYSIVSPSSVKPRFSVDSETGEIRTAYTFDSDEPTREKEEYLVVRAIDNRIPQLYDVCTIKVTIEDINDNTPVFDKLYGTVSVPQDHLPGNKVTRLAASDIDDGNNSLVDYNLEPTRSEDAMYFHIDKNTGVIILDKPIDKEPGDHFEIQVTARDHGEFPTSVTTDLKISIVESHKKAPAFTSVPASPIKLKEDLSNYTYNIATFDAKSNTDEKYPVFELVTGRSEQTNKLNTFRLESENGQAYILLARPLDYEFVKEYALTVRTFNKYSLADEAVIVIQVEDVNDNIPNFTHVVLATVLENEPPGTYVTQVRAVDGDGSPQHNQVTYELAGNKEYFRIDKHTGNITTLVTFNREIQGFYNVKVYATDMSPSALFPESGPNRGQQNLLIEIAENKNTT